MAEIALKTTIPDVTDRSYGYGATHVDNPAWVANTSAAVQYVTAPFDGVLKQALCSADVTSDATATYTFLVTNQSNSDVELLATTLFDADPVLTAGTPSAATLSTTTANLSVSKGDIISVSMAGGTGSGNAGLVLTWETA